MTGVDTTLPGYPTDKEWLAATPGGIIQTTGLCDIDQIHDRHTFTSAVHATHTSGWHCWGQASVCRNCDDRKCMDCCGRIIHDDCKDDCPVCCNPGGDAA